MNWNEIAVMGHSRSGGAVVHAVQFNRLSRYPDDAGDREHGPGVRPAGAVAAHAAGARTRSAPMRSRSVAALNGFWRMGVSGSSSVRRRASSSM